MNLLYKPDWPETKERFQAWWAHEALDRCMLQVTAPKEGVPPEDPPKVPEKIEDRWLDFDYLRAANDYRMRRTFYGGEAFPTWNPGYPGWSYIPCYMGARIDLQETTGWIYPIIEDGALTDHDYHDLTIEPDNPWWVRSQEMVRFAVQEARGKSIPGILTIGGCGDTLAALRGTENLLTDMIDCPDYVREFDQHLMRMWRQVYEIMYGIILDGAEGSTCWFSLWSPCKFDAPQNDFAYMISPAMFREVFLPSIEMQTQFLDHAVYHVDGIGNFAHLDALLELPRLQAFQILPGSGKPSPLHYMDVLKHVQDAGKNLHIGIPATEVEVALSQLSARGLCIDTWCKSEAEARDLLRKCAQWSRS
jgi:hypothetical protein